MLLADDYLPLLTALERLLKPDCELIGRATTGGQLLQEASAKRPDVVVVDLRLPEVNGIEACRRLRLFRPELKVIVLTAADDGTLRQAAMAAGASDFIPKRLVIERLAASIRHAVSQHDGSG